MVYSVTQLARYLDVSTNTVRNWGDTFADYLSPSANPAKGEPRRYNEDDTAVLETVAVLRSQNVDYDDIAQRLDADERLAFQNRSTSIENQVKDASAGASQGELITRSFADALQQHDAQLARLLDHIAELQEARLDAEKRAVAAETELRILRERQAQENAPGHESDAQERPWWQFWR